MTAVDTNVLVALLNRDEALSLQAEQAMNRVLDLGGVVISATVWSELRAFPSRDDAMLQEFLGLREIQ